MRLLILTQKVDTNDDILGFMHGWIKEFAGQCEKVIAVCLSKGEYNLPENVKVLSLGKERGGSRLKYLLNFYRYIWQERNNYNTVFVHMNEQYVILGWPLWKLLGKRIGLWYAHGHVSFALKMAEKMADIIFTSTKSGFRLASKKVNVVGQGIDTKKFSIFNFQFSNKSQKFKIISVGRISLSKDYETLIKAVEILVKNGIKLQVDIIGGLGLPKDRQYLDYLKKMIGEKKLDEVINFAGSVPNKDITNHLESAQLFVNMGQTGSLDKAVLEAMACGLPVLTCNEALTEVLGKYKEMLMYPKKDYKKLAEKIQLMMEMSDERNKIGIALRRIIIQDHNLEGLITKIIKWLSPIK